MGFEISADSKADNIIPNKKELKTASAQAGQESVFEKERPTVVVIDDFANKKYPLIRMIILLICLMGTG